MTRYVALLRAINVGGVRTATPALAETFGLALLAVTAWRTAAEPGTRPARA